MIPLSEECAGRLFTERTSFDSFPVFFKKDDRPAYVNVHMLCAISDKLTQIFFDAAANDFRSCVRITEVSRGDFLKLLNYACPNQQKRFNRRWTDDNMIPLLTCVRVFDIPSVFDDCLRYIIEELEGENVHYFQAKTLVQAALMLREHNVEEKYLEQIYKKLAQKGRHYPEVAIRKLDLVEQGPLFDAINRHLPKWVQIGPEVQLPRELERRVFM